VFVAAGFAHGVLDATPFDASPLLRWELRRARRDRSGVLRLPRLLARFFLSPHDYQVQAIDEIADGPVEIVLQPLGRHMEFVR
jgi:hypothetical protein